MSWRRAGADDDLRWSYHLHSIVQGSCHDDGRVVPGGLGDDDDDEGRALFYKCPLSLWMQAWWTSRPGSWSPSSTRSTPA
jgi:hypothetical protein